MNLFFFFMFLRDYLLESWKDIKTISESEHLEHEFGIINIESAIEKLYYNIQKIEDIMSKTRGIPDVKTLKQRTFLDAPRIEMSRIGRNISKVIISLQKVSKSSSRDVISLVLQTISEELGFHYYVDDTDPEAWLVMISKVYTVIDVRVI
jgi:hypothetical protein